MENSKSGKKGLLIVACVVVIVIAAVVFCLFGLRKNYKSVVKEFAKATESEEKMEKFVKKNIDLKAVYAMQQVAEDEDIDMDDEDEVEKAFKKEYKKAKKSDYEDLEDELQDVMKSLVMDEKLEVKEIGNLEEFDEMPLFKSADVTFEYEDEEETLIFIFYKNKIVSFDYSSAALEAVERAEESMNQQARAMYNSAFEVYIGEDVSATSVKALIQNVIDSNNQNVDEEGKFVSLEIDGELSGEDDFEDLNDACEEASDDNDDDNVSAAASEMSKIKSKIVSSKKYDVIADYENGVIVNIIISEQ